MGSKSSITIVLLAVALTFPTVLAQSSNECDLPSEAPDVIVGKIHQTLRWGEEGGITAFSLGTTSCNVGTCWAKWIAQSPEHPVIAQNIFRVKDGRIEQLGQSWLKHAFFAVSGELCSEGCIGTSGDHLGVNCADPYSANLNGDQDRLGPKFEVNPYTGVFPWPPTDHTLTGDAIYKRLQVHNVDLDPALNPASLYYAESQYVTADDNTATGTGDNNVSYREIAVLENEGEFDISPRETTTLELPGIYAWKDLDPDVDINIIDVPADGRMFAAARATSIGANTWRYEYAVQNLTSHRAARTFEVPLAPGTIVGSVGFNDVDYHSGEPFSGTDWSATVDTSQSPPKLIWTTETFSENENANALRWGTLYNFYFEADRGPTIDEVEIGLFRPGSPGSVVTMLPTPQGCDDNGTCEGLEDCANCPGDCPSGPESCCGDGTCESDEDPCACSADCGPPPSMEASCNDGIDEDCDGAADCLDLDCCIEPGCDGQDSDSDTFGACSDCDDENGSAWMSPSEVGILQLTHDVPSGVTTLFWDSPADSGASSVTYETLRAPAADGFNGQGTQCLEAANPAMREVSDAEAPQSGSAMYYLVRSLNACPAVGTLGSQSDGTTRIGLPCR